MSREGIERFEEIFNCQVLDKYNLTDTKVPAVLAGWSLDYPLIIFGEYDREYNIIAFKLEDAIVQREPENNGS